MLSILAAPCFSADASQSSRAYSPACCLGAQVRQPVAPKGEFIRNGRVSSGPSLSAGTTGSGGICLGDRRRARADSYRVWISEIMLQQTTVAAVTPYFESFLTRWPRLESRFGGAGRGSACWQGLGYYARAQSACCARRIAARHAGSFPEDEASLRLLPGIGSYTAAAIAAIAFDRPTTPVDGNVLRVVARLHALNRLCPPRDRRSRLSLAR